MSKTQSGFTLIEILVVTVILGMLMTVAANVFITILSNQNKTALIAEIRQNAALVIDTFERDVHSAQSVGVCSGATCTVVQPNGTQIVWTCSQPTAADNHKISRQVGAGTVVDITNTDKVSGVDLASCSIFSRPVSGSLAILDFQMRQAINSPAKVEFSTSDVDFRTTVGPRAGAH